jgi:hypothetical protein
MNGNALEKTPQTGANAGGQLYGQVDERSKQQQRQPQIHDHPQRGLPSQARLGQAVTHHGLHWGAFKQSVPHASMLTKAGVLP